MAHPAFVWRAYYRQNRGSFPSAFPAGKLDALAIFEEDDGEGRKTLITHQRTPVPGGVLALSGEGVGWEVRGTPCPLQSHRGTAWELPWESCGIWGAFNARPVEGGRFGGLVPPSVPRRGGRAVAPVHPTPRCQGGPSVPSVPCPMLQGGFCPRRGVKPRGCACCTCSQVPVGRQHAPTDICQA